MLFLTYIARMLTLAVFQTYWEPLSSTTKIINYLIGAKQSSNARLINKKQIN